MELEITKILKECVTVDTPLDVVVNIAEELFSPIFKIEDLLVFESMVMPFSGFKYYYFTISYEIKNGRYSTHIKLDLKYEATPTLMALHNLFWAEDLDEFWKLIRSTHAYNYLLSQNIKPFAVEVLEI